MFYCAMDARSVFDARVSLSFSALQALRELSRAGRDPGTGRYPFSVTVTGPFGAPAQSHEDYRRLLLVASGVGATPMVSVLNSLRYEIETRGDLRVGTNLRCT